MYLLVKTTLSASGRAHYITECADLDSAKRQYHQFLGTMIDENSVLYCMASVITETGVAVDGLHESWYRTQTAETTEVEA